MDKTFVKGLTLLELLAKSDKERGVSDLARELGLTKSNVHRLLSTLQSQGYVRQLPANSAYEPTSKLWELGALVRSRLDVTKVSHDAMVGLRKSTGESVHLSIRDADEVVYVDKLDGTHAIKAYTTIGGRAPLWCVATGKALLAFARLEEIEAVASRLVRYTERTIVDRASLLSEMQSVRRNGYAVNHGEWREGVCGIAAPIYDSGRSVVAAVGISGPSMRFRTKDLKARAAFVLEAAAGISAALGYRDPGLRDPVPGSTAKR
jgi:DNA-binding IclR family transcriptional regulator